MSKLKIAAQCYTIYNYIQNDADFVASMKKIKDIGFDTVQLSGHTNVTPSLITETLKKEGLTCCITHSPYGRILNDFDNLVAEHKAWGCSVVGIGGMPGGFTQNLDGYNAFAREANLLGDKLASVGMKLAYHNHSGEFIRREGGVRCMDVFLDKFNENVEFEPDLFWVQHAGVNPYDWLYRVEGRVSTVHFKDYRINPANNQPDVAEIGYGNMDYVKLAKISEETGIKFAAIEQDTTPGDPFDSLKMSFEYLKKIGY